MMIKYYTSVRTDRHIHARLFKISIACARYFYYSGSLTSAYALLFARNTYGAASNTNFYKIRTCLRKKSEAFLVYDIARAYLYIIAIRCANKVYCTRLPLRITLG